MKKYWQQICLAFAAITALSSCANKSEEQATAEVEKIDRQALVTRHNVVITEPDTLNSLTVGNGEFAFTADVSGLQTFYEDYENGVSLGTQSQWGWHAFPNEGDYKIEEVYRYDTSCTGNVMPHPVQWKEVRKNEATNYLRQNPHRLHLGIIGFELLKENGEKALLSDLQEIHQELNPWTGALVSEYQIEGNPVKVELYGHQDEDGISAKVTSPLIDAGRLKVFMKFPYGSGCHVCPGYDWTKPELHSTEITSAEANKAVLKRTLDTTQYFVATSWNGEAEITEVEKHYFQLTPKGESFEFSVLFNKDEKNTTIPDFASTQTNSETKWKDFWTKGAAIDFSGSTDPRADELERRVILSQYLTKVNCAGSLPPQETGLTFNSWYGKFHMEMHWWHGVHFPLWNRPELLSSSLHWYDDVLDKAKHTAEMQHFTGARWQKMTDPYGDESPSGVAPYLVWQQPHIIYFAELLYRQDSSAEVLEKYKDLVFETAEFMASFPQKMEDDDYYHLCNPVKPAQEHWRQNETVDPPFELNYWYFGLNTALAWQKRLGLETNKTWELVLNNLAPLPQQDDIYFPTATHPDAYTNMELKRDHPIVTGILGYLPNSPLVDTVIMKNTYNKVLSSWQWETTWGWDYPMMAMCAARLNMPEKAVDALFMDLQKNTYLKNGHNYQDDRLRIYLPGNGGLLTAVAMMAAGWDGAPDSHAPGFPKEGWNVRYEGFKKMP